MTVETPTTLREIAARAYQRLQDEIAARRRQDCERRRESLLAGARDALVKALMVGPSDPWGLPREALREARYEIASTDDVLEHRPDDAVVRIEILGERFEYRYGGYGWGLYHCWRCPVCGRTDAELPTATNRVESLADLGAWLAYAPTLCTGHPSAEASDA